MTLHRSVPAPDGLVGGLWVQCEPMHEDGHQYAVTGGRRGAGLVRTNTIRTDLRDQHDDPPYTVPPWLELHWLSPHDASFVPCLLMYGEPVDNRTEMWIVPRALRSIYLDRMVLRFSL